MSTDEQVGARGQVPQEGFARPEALEHRVRARLVATVQQKVQFTTLDGPLVAAAQPYGPRGGSAGEFGGGGCSCIYAH